MDHLVKGLGQLTDERTAVIVENNITLRIRFKI